ncbi:MAG: hypothetical protein K6F99_00490 [Lachnospiraceae bacterium]|nr:hypothetical protein [Lachnospiraceae bacterium]
MANFYNASSRVNFQNSRVQAPAKADEIKQAEKSSEVNGTVTGNTPAAQESTLEHTRETRVSAEASYQKSMITDRSFAMERLASKLMDRLPRIMADIAKLDNVKQDISISNQPTEEQLPADTTQTMMNIDL